MGWTIRWRKPAGPGILALVVSAAAIWGWQAFTGRRARPVAVPFTDVTRSAGIRFQHTHGGCGERYFPEMFSSGCAFIDYDGDGYLDLYLVNGAPLPGCRIQDYQGCRLYRNDGNGSFTDVTASAGVGNQGGYGLGCCAGDYDNDGRPDLYVTNYGANRLYHNEGDGRFTDVAARAGVRCHRFSTSCAFADYDNDGYLDLFVCNYADYKPGDDLRCRAHKSVPSYCRPTDLHAQQSVLYRNDGDGTFTDVSRTAGIVVPDPGRALGVVWSDLDNDGDPDIYVANDQTPNFLFRNNGNGTFSEVGRASGVAVNGNGRAEAGMGVDAGDWNHTGYFDLFVTNFSNETNTLYHNHGQLQFTDMTERTGLGQISLKFLAFGTAFFDFDRDGHLDLFVANGHVWDDVGIWEYGITYPERAFLFHNDGRGHFDEVGRLCGPYFATPRVGRGAAVGDYDNDGDLDLLVNNSNQTPNLLRNDLQPGAHWIQFQLTGTRSNRSAIGARVQVTAGGLRQMAEVRSGSSYCSQNDLRLTFGLGRQSQAEKVTIRWPAGETETLENLAAGRLYRIREGAGGSSRAERPARGAASVTMSARRLTLVVAGAVVVMLAAGSLLQRRERAPLPRAVAAVPAQHPSSPPPRGMVFIPAGSFLMGAADLDEDETPVHAVFVDAFYLDVCEVTNEQFARFVGASGYRPEGNWYQFAGKGKERLPLVGVTWEDAAVYCRWAGKRLPTEAEWERAARGPRGYRYSYGDHYAPQLANVDSRAAKPVGSYPPNGFGLYDMSGNAAEWCADWYAPSSYRASPARNPHGPSAGDFKVVRGGSWYNLNFLPYPSRCDARFFLAPHSREPTIGFRCARSARVRVGGRRR